ncbi:hypothetical protein ACP275_03G079400 [Erythranthe tilingii]
MKSLYYPCFGFFYLVLVSFMRESNAESNGVYIVYMGASRYPDGAPRNDHAQLLSSLMKRKRNPVVHTYRNGFSGFAARLSEEEAKSIAEKPGVVSVFRDPVLQLHTTRSWDFLKYQTALKIDATTSASSPSQSPYSSGDDTIIGILDTGIWPESESFIDDDMGPIPPYWKGKCMAGLDFNSSNCNRKIIGAKYYTDPDAYDTPRDGSGHGTHVASTAAGAPVSGASYYGLAKGTAQGGSTASRIAMYRVCVDGGCSGSAIMKGFDDAIADGVHVLSLSLGGSPGRPNFQTDPVAIGAFHAVEHGITVVCSAGNSGPSPASAVNVAPWIMTVAATTIDRDFQADIVLGGNKVIKGGGINFSNLNKSTMYPLIDGRSAKLSSNVNGDDDAGNCIPGSLDDSKVKGKIVVCENKDESYEPRDKFEDLQQQGAIGMIVIDNDERQVATKYESFPVAAVSEDDGAQILSYINSTRSKAVATILPTVVVNDYKPAPSVAYFSARGPIRGIQNLIKPDITAPGVSILAAWPSNDLREAVAPGRDPPLFDILSGTSMSCPHVSGLTATVKSQHPKWSPSAIKSAIMTTAITTNNVHSLITTETGKRASPYDIGSGEISISSPLQPGLVYETETSDYVEFLCNLGYNTDKIKTIASAVPEGFSCKNNVSNPDEISNMNYPSIAVSNLKKNVSKTANRTVTNVGEEDSTYTVSVEAPDELSVEVVPNKLVFSKNVEKLSFRVIFTLGVDSDYQDFFGSITWSNEKHRVRSPFVVSNASQNELM